MDASAAFIGAMVAIAFLSALLTAQVALRLVPDQPDEARLGAIDGFRGFLGISVMFAHFGISLRYRTAGTWDSAPYYALGNFGANAVIAFFMITGFLFYRKLVTSRRPVSWTDLYRGRLFRLTPVYWIAITAMFAIAFAHTGYAIRISLFDVVKSALSWYSFTLVWARFVNGYAGTSLILAGVVWTLRYEWLFYFLLPALYAVVRRIADPVRRTVLFIIPLMLASALLSRVSFAGLSPKFLVAFAIGMFGAELGEFPRLRAALRSGYGTLAVAAGVIGATLLDDGGYTLVRFLVVALVFLPVAAGNTLNGLLLGKALRLLGDASYSTYLLHGLVLHLFFQAAEGRVDFQGHAVWFAMPVLAAIVSALSIFSYFCVEKPFIALGRSPWRRGSRVAPTREFAP